MKTSLLLWQKDRLNIRNNAIRAMTVAVKAERSSCLKMYTFHTVNIVNTHSGVGSLLKTMPWGGEVEWGGGGGALFKQISEMSLNPKEQLINNIAL